MTELLTSSNPHLRTESVDPLVSDSDLSARVLSTVIGALRDGVVVVDANGVVTMANGRAAELAGRSLDQLVRRPVHELFDTASEHCPVTPTLVNGEPRTDLIRTDAIGQIRWLLVNTAPIVDAPTAEVRGAVATIAEITDLIAAQSELEELASRDSLTGLANRGRLHDRLQTTLDDAARTRDHLALLFLDLDGFKRVNDSLGHAHGDRLLQLVAERISQQLRPDDVVARIGGDEFVILLPDVGGDQARAEAVAADVAARAIAVTEEPFHLGEQAVRISASIGIALAGPGADSPDELLRRADLAMYSAKQDRGSGHRLYDQRMDQEAQRALRLDSELREAIDNHDLVLHLQPRFSVATGELSGAETLLRWRDDDPTRPDTASVVAAAERSGLIAPLGRWVLAEAIAQAAELWRAGVLGQGRTLSVNVSSLQLRDDRFPAQVSALLDHHDLPARLLTVELTEWSILDDLYQARRQMKALEALGVRLSIDDFGTGYSSLAYLRELPVHELKLDRLFVTDLGRDRTAEVIARGVVDIAHGIGLTTVAEGVEQSEQLDVLYAMECDDFQGHLVAAALPLVDFLRQFGA